MSSLTSSTDDASPVPYASANLEDQITISPVLASRICTSVLEHVLYLNGQIPFPVQGLSSLKLDGKANAKAAKKRDELMAALDVLSSHLPSTFQSLSWALGTNPQLLRATSSSATTAVDVVLVTGPSPTTVRSRCFIRLEDFSISRYGERRQATSSVTPAKSAEPVSTHAASPRAQAQACLPAPSLKEVEPTEVQEDLDEEEHDPEADASFTSFISDMSSALSSTVEEEHSEDEGTEGEEEAEESDASSSVASEEDEEEDDSEEDYDEEEEEEEEGSVVVETDSAVHTSIPISPAHKLAPNSSTEPPSHSPSEAEQSLRSSVRAVSLSLASTFDFGRDDIPVTQVNILLRAPRCFQHPSWLPKQALGRTLDGRVEDFFSGRTCSGGKENRKGPPEEGVLVRCKSSLEEGADELPESPPSQTLGNELHGEDAGQHDMIWWQWSAGVIRGFGDI